MSIPESTQKKLIENQKIFQFDCTKAYPEVYSFVEKCGTNLSNEFHLKFMEWKNKKNQRKFEEGQQLPTLGAVQKELLTERDHEEENISWWAKRKRTEGRRNQRKAKRGLFAAKDKKLKCLKKAKKTNKKELWGRLQELNDSFAKIKENKQTNKKQ